MDFLHLALLALPLSLMGAVTLITRSGIIPKAYGILTGEDDLTDTEFEYVLLGKSYFLHKIWTCSICQSFHCSWISAAAWAWLGGMPLWAFCPAVFAIFLVLYRMSGPTGLPFAPAPPRSLAADVAPDEGLLTPELPFLKRISTGEKGKAGQLDEVAHRATTFLMPETKPFFDGYEELRERHREELERLQIENPNCPKCKEGEVTRKYFDHVIALIERGETF